MFSLKFLSVYLLWLALTCPGNTAFGVPIDSLKKGIVRPDANAAVTNGGEQGVAGSYQKEARKRRNWKDGKKEYGSVVNGESKIPTVKDAAITPERRKKQAIYYPETEMKKRYKMSVVLPLYLDELVRGQSVTFMDKVPDKAASGLAFYQGLKLAADSLERQGMKLDIRVFDAGSFAESPEMLIDRRRFDSTDLIIGLVEQHDIPILASYARKRRINFISALRNYDGWVKDNQFFTMLQPSVKSHCEFIIDDLSARFAGEKVTLFYRTSSLADDNAALYMLNDLYSEVTFRKVLCNSLPDKESLADVLDTTKPNVVVVSILDHVFADSILQHLSASFPNVHFEIYGMPGWNKIANLRKSGSFKNLTVNVSYPFNFEPADSAMMGSIRLQYSKEFGGNVSEMVLRGYETILWYGTLLQKYGTIFNEDYKDISGAPFTKFRIKPRWDRNGSLLYLENKQIYMSTYQGGIYRTR